jgi:hypothetical protein
MPRPSRDALVLAALVTLGAALRLALARGDLWLDELWSLSFARQIQWPWDVVTGIHHDNNHPLNTLALFFTVKIAGAHAPPIVYRLLSLAAGIALIPLVFWTEVRAQDPLARQRAWIAATLSACSFLAVVYSSEARGYSPAALFAVLAFALVRARDLTISRNRALFALVCTLGLFSHLTFLFVYAGLAAWTLARFVTQRGQQGQRRGLRGWIALHQVPLVVIAGIYLIDARKLVYGGGPAFTFTDVVTRVLSFAAGGPDAGAGKWIAIASVTSVIAYAMWLLVRERDDEWIFFATGLIAAPLLVLASYEARFLDVRYFFVLVPFLWLLAARAVAFLATQRYVGRSVATTLVIVSVIGNLAHLEAPLRDGRGHYKAAVWTMASLTAGENVTVSSDHDFRNRLVIDYYGEEHPLGKTITYQPAPDVSAEWYLTHTIDPAGDVVPPRTITPEGRSYVWIKSFTYGGVSGWNWHLYRRQPRP